MTTESVRLQGCLDRLRAGDASARDDILAFACERLEQLTRRMLKGYPGVHRWEQTGDVLQNALVRLSRTLADLTPPTVLDFYRLAALQIRRELIDLARHYYGPQGAGGHHASVGGNESNPSLPPAYDRADRTGEPTAVLAWAELHRQAELLPEDERTVFDLLWYQGLKQDEAAEILGVTTRTIKNWWRSARLKLYDALGGDFLED